MKPRFTVDGSSGLEFQLEFLCQTVARGVQACIPQHLLEGLALAGGYGRGEGGVLRTDTGDHPYNDLEFFVFIRGLTQVNDFRFGTALQQLGHDLSAIAGIEVEFKILSLAKLRTSAPTMFYYDLLKGHRWLLGDDTLLEGCAHHGDASRIPLHEATRLLMNRCSGLLYAKERLQRDTFTSEDADFVNRNLAKAQLALGDVLLAASGQYHWSCRERAQRLLTLESTFPDMTAVRHQHAEGVKFKLLPSVSSASRNQLQLRHEQISALAQQLWLWLESKRLGASFSSVSGYAGSAISICPEQPWWRNLAVNVRTFKLRIFKARALTRYPRERLLRALSLLLWGVTDAPAQAIVAKCLQAPALSFRESVQAYTHLWHRFN
jgi:hypothetical protein